MKKIITGLLALLCLVAYKSDAKQKSVNQKRNIMMTTERTTNSETLLTAQERDDAITFLKETESGVSSAIKDLNEAKLTFKPAADKWSIEECVKHIAAAESNLWEMVEKSLKQPANPEKRAGIKFTDQELVKAVEDRAHKSKTFAALEPANSPFKTLPEALASFRENREKLIAFVRTTRLDLRNHVSVLPIGTYDAYQFILLISAHTRRHTKQIEDVKAAADFPGR